MATTFRVTQVEIARVITRYILEDRVGAVAGILGNLKYLVRSGHYTPAAAKETYRNISRIWTDSLIRDQIVPPESRKSAVQDKVVSALTKAFSKTVSDLKTTEKPRRR